MSRYLLLMMLVVVMMLCTTFGTTTTRRGFHNEHRPSRWRSLQHGHILLVQYFKSTNEYRGKENVQFTQDVVSQLTLLANVVKQGINNGDKRDWFIHLLLQLSIDLFVATNCDFAILSFRYISAILEFSTVCWKMKSRMNSCLRLNIQQIKRKNYSFFSHKKRHHKKASYLHHRLPN